MDPRIMYFTELGIQASMQALPHTPSRGFVARTDTLELYAHECRQDLWTVSNRERVARRAACHLSVAGAQVLGQVKVVGAVTQAGKLALPSEAGNHIKAIRIHQQACRIKHDTREPALTILC